MLNVNFLETFNMICNCFFPRTSKEEELDRNIYKVSREFKISILPITPNFDIDNLYPLTDHVELWNIFIVGNDKTYILANVNDPHIRIPEATHLPNNKGHNVLPNELVMVFDRIWTKTLLGKQLQFYMVWNSKLYFVNTYPFFNGKKQVIGAILFMRAFETMPETKFATSIDGYIIPIRHSDDDSGYYDKMKNAKTRTNIQHTLTPNEAAEKAKAAFSIE